MQPAAKFRREFHARTFSAIRTANWIGWKSGFLGQTSAQSTSILHSVQNYETSPLTRRRASNVIDKDLTNKKLLFNLILTRSYLCALGVGRRRVKG